jgi:uncharacterized protein (DUF58 family)
MALTGRAVWLALAGLLLLVWWPSGAAVRVWWLVLLFVVVVDIVRAPSPRSLRLERLDVPQVRLGSSTRATLRVTNTATRTARGVLRDAWQPSAGAFGERHVLRLDGGRRTAVTTTLTPTRRGDRLADRVTVRLTGPLGVAARQRSFDVPGHARALPPFHSRKHLPSRLAVLRQLDGRSAVRIRGQGTEFDSLRDYVEGDDVRSIDWRATARRQHLVVRTWQPERDRRIVLVLDTSRTSSARVGDAPRLDSAMDAALLLAAVASHAGDRVTLLAGDRAVRTRVGGGSDRSGLLHDLVTGMAPLEPSLVEADWRALAGEVHRAAGPRALVVLLTPLEPSAVEESLLPVLPGLTDRHRVVLASVADPEVAAMRAERSTPASTYAAAAAERTTALRERTARALGRLGVTVIDAVPEELPPRLADHYLLLKGRGLL